MVTFLVLEGPMGVLRSKTSTGTCLTFSGVASLGVLDRDFPFNGEVLATLGVTDLDLLLGVSVPVLETSVGVELSFGVVVRDLKILSTGVWLIFDWGKGDRSSWS